MTTDMHQVAIVSFEGAVQREMKRVRNRLAQANIGSTFQFEIYCSGRVQDGDVDITFKIGDYSDNVKGNSVDATLEEYMRRHGWDAAHKPICISSRPLGDEVDESDIPY